MSIAEEYLYAFLASQLFFVVTLHAELAYVVTLLVVVIVIDIALGYLCHITKDMGSIGVLVLTNGATLDVEAREAEHLLAEDGEVVLVELSHEDLLGITRVARVLVAVLDGVHTVNEHLLGNAEGLAEVEGVDMVLRLVHHHHDIEGGLVIDKEFAITVVDGTA